jgi:hypothetical protein
LLDKALGHSILATYFKVQGCSRYFRQTHEWPIVKVATSKYFSEVNMMKAKEIVEKVAVSNNLKSPQWEGKKGNSYLMWKIKYQAHMVMLGLEEALTPDFASKLPTKR